jgi:hypothetical protein
MPATRDPRIRPLTIAFVAIAVSYLASTADAVPSWVAGDQAGGTHHHIERELGFTSLAIETLVGAWISTSPSVGPNDVA